ncbi:MAG: hypothetical protein COX82_04875 [Candidatus Magasanikbacteria bacterium CG_4_10_14_0_2_um_filter_41_10]|uniref:Uncharacterized protein n=1 Tax=Candidatus Magasanikbacteria bacterium CG_4_10_14_0_2_um_filter_41_10 TaxID=1974638 RepID=A0A2M7V1Z5_9BACT|nr:MAG: hypothetical protein COX82_04875 [Candidatus Magasanikbacteria bacterium CG_4_10_14_0_2_um_filter_41_10]
METPPQTPKETVAPIPIDSTEPVLIPVSHVEKKWWILFGTIATVIVVFFVYALTLFLSSRQNTSDVTIQPTEQNKQVANDISQKEEQLPVPLVEAPPTFQSYLDGLSYTENDEEGLNIATYTINSDRSITKASLTSNPTYLQESNNVDEHTFLWTFYTDIFTDVPDIGYLKRFIINTDGEEGSLASIYLDDSYVWELYIDPADALRDGKLFDPQDFTYTLVHEFGHLFTLNESQVDYSVIYEDECSTHLLSEGCLYPTAYFTQYFSEFWEGDLYDEWYMVVDGESEDNVELFYNDYEDEFVTEYAATDPTEDIAESFAHFVLLNKPNAVETIAEEKISFFYDFPELVSLRDTIRHNIEQKDPAFFSHPLLIK